MVWPPLLSRVPIIGDPLTLVAGIFRAPFLSFAAIVTLAKAPLLVRGLRCLASPQADGQAC